MQRPKDGSDVTGFGSFDNTKCKRVLDLLEPGDLRLGQVVIKSVAVVELGVNSGSGDVVTFARFCESDMFWPRRLAKAAQLIYK